MQLIMADQVAKILNVKKFRVFEMARKGLIPCVRMGRQIRFDEETLTKWIASGGTIKRNSNDEGGRND